MSPGPFSSSSAPSGPHVKMELLVDRKSIHIYLWQRGQWSSNSLCSSSCSVTGKWLSSQRLHFPAPLAFWQGPITSLCQRNGSKSDLCPLWIVTGLFALRSTSLPAPCSAYSVGDCPCQQQCFRLSVLVWARLGGGALAGDWKEGRREEEDRIFQL